MKSTHLILSRGHHKGAGAAARMKKSTGASKYASDLWHIEYKAHRDLKRVSLTSTSVPRQQNNINPGRDGSMLPRRTF